MENYNGMPAFFYRAVLFDLDDTLHDDDDTMHRAAERVAVDIADERGVDAALLHQMYFRAACAFWENLSESHLITKLVDLRKQMWWEALRAVGVDDEALAERAAINYNSYRNEHLRLFPGVLELLDSLHMRGIATALVTNGFAETHSERIALLKLENAFDEIFIADEVGMVKPDPRLFVHVCERLKTLPAESVMVGDRFDRDIRGAQAAGLQTVWFNVRNEQVPLGDAPPSETVYTIHALAAALRLR
jgi:HAD superfamily hydrolase (TIGR01509 family)